jgi:hypothetical protein
MPESAILQRIERATGKFIETIRPIQRGYTPAERLLLSFTDSSTAFAKIGTTPLTAGWLRQEKRIYEALQSSFMPKFLGWDDDNEHPILLLEDLRHADWPPPWSEVQIQRVVDTLPRMWASRVGNSHELDNHLHGLPRLAHRPGIYDGWREVAIDPEPFLSLQLATEKWLEATLPVFLNIRGEEVVQGDSLLHLDIRSDNLCFVGERVVIIDWNLVCLGNPKVDFGFWLPSLEAEGGPLPETILPDAGEIAGLVSGFFASRAGQPNIPDAPFVRHIQQVQLKAALPWAVRALGLPPLDGIQV